jgi:two-component system, OmpR family, phosphate regulon sensor histidine kinase PhoR
MNRVSLVICVLACVAMVISGASLWLALAILVAWLGTLWLAKPEPIAIAHDGAKRDLSAKSIALLIEQLELPLIVVRADRILAANAAARLALGGHIVDQDIRIGLRHPQAIALMAQDAVASETDAAITIKGLTTPRSVWQLTRHRIDARLSLIELVDQTAQADISRAHTDFVANASHELRTPLASIIGFVETLADPKAGADAATRTKFLATMGREARRMQHLVEDLMSLSRIEAEKHDLPQDRFSLTDVVKGVVHDVTSLTVKNRVVFDPVQTPSTVVGDRAQIEQLVRNLIDNAIKYGDPKAPVTVTLGGSGGQITLRIADKGPGIPSEQLPYLTRRFYRTDPGRSREAGGTGLGLAIVKHIVERHRGQLDIASVMGEGTQVSVRLPLAD